MRSCRRCAQSRPDIVVNAGAYTAVDAAERERDAAFAVNARAPQILADEAKRADAVLIHYSTDYVFDGAATTPYDEDAPTAPLNVYGESKLEGERAIAASGAHALVLRTSWVYGLRGRNFLLTIRRLAAERDELRIVADQTGTPNWSRTLAQATADLVARGPAVPGRTRGPVSPELDRRDDVARLRDGDRRRRRHAARPGDQQRRIPHARAPARIRRAGDGPLSRARSASSCRSGGMRWPPAWPRLAAARRD